MTTRISFDRWGIAHIDAPTLSEAVSAQGWVAARDRMWQMEWDRRRALGRWSEVVGFGGAKEDAFFLRLGLAEAARSDYETLRSDTRRLLDSYTDGINRWLDAPDLELPAEFEHHPAPPEPWEPWHCVAVYKVRHIFMGSLYRKLWRGYILGAAGPELTAALRGDPSDQAAMVIGDGPAVELLDGAAQVLAEHGGLLRTLLPPEGGSNSWAVHGSRTSSGLPLLAGDPHRGIEFPNVYHQCHVRCPDVDVIGLAFPGVPGFPHFGHNEDVAWCITHGMADDTDVFVERFPDGEPPADWHAVPMQIRGEQPVDVWCGSTPRGPVVLGDPADGVALSMAWTGTTGPDTTLDALEPMMRATSCEELEASVRPWVIPVNNLLTADRNGDISFRLRGRLVERPVASRWIPVPGDDEHAWTGAREVPFDELPQERNPARGFLVTANNRTSDRGPFVSLDFAGSSRHDRIVELLEELSSAAASDMEQIHCDVRSLVAPTVVRLILDFATRCEHPSSPALLELLENWDAEVSEASVAASVYAVVRRRWAEGVVARLGVDAVEFGAPGWPRSIDASRMSFEGASTLLVDGTWHLVPGLHDRDAMVSAISSCVDEAATELEQRLGPDISTWTWGRIHRMASPHPLANALHDARGLHPPIDGCPGDGDTVRCGTMFPETGERAAAASVARYVFDLADWDNSGWVVPHGVSGVPGSGHDLDQRAQWLAGALIPMSFSRAAVAAATVETVDFSD